MVSHTDPEVPVKHEIQQQVFQTGREVSVNPTTRFPEAPKKRQSGAYGPNFRQRPDVNSKSTNTTTRGGSTWREGLLADQVYFAACVNLGSSSQICLVGHVHFG